MRIDEFAARALEEGRLDEAIRHLSEPDHAAAEPQLLAQLLTLRGRFDDALAVVRRDVEARAASGPLTAADLRSRGNAAWRADRLGEALQDLRLASAAAHDPAQAQVIQTDLANLESQVASMGVVARRLDQVNHATIALGVVLAVAFLVVGRVFRR